MMEPCSPSSLLELKLQQHVHQQSSQNHNGPITRDTKRPISALHQSSGDLLTLPLERFDIEEAARKTAATYLMTSGKMKMTIDNEYRYKAILENGHWLELERRVASRETKLDMEICHHLDNLIDDEESMHTVALRAQSPGLSITSMGTVAAEETAQAFVFQVCEAVMDMIDTLDRMACCYGKYGTHCPCDDILDEGGELIGLAFVPDD